MFTQEYIELCKDKKIQELRNVFLPKHETVYEKENRQTYRLDNDVYLPERHWFIWLPTSDQLDKEIDKIIKTKAYGNYEVTKNYSRSVKWSVFASIRNNQLGWFEHDNILIAKIKLLIELLKEKG